MNKLPKEKRNKVILVWLVTLVVVAGWAFVFLRWQLDSKFQAEQNLTRRQQQFAMMSEKLNGAERIERDKAESEQDLLSVETGMASGDVYSWSLDTLTKFKQNYPRVEMPQFGQIVPGENTLLPKFPYKQAALTVAGSAYYHDLGLFIADFENQFKFARILNLELQPVAPVNAPERDREKLSFKMDIVFLVKPNQP